MKRVLSHIATAVLVVLLGYGLYTASLRLAATRMYDVEECRNVFVARVLAAGETDGRIPGVSLLQVPLVALAKGAQRSIDLFISARTLSVLVFWLNLILLALATGEKLLSRRGLAALVGAATLSPLWNFGFEVRPENLFLSCWLLLWCAVRGGGLRAPTYLLVGALAVVMQFLVPEAIWFSVPLTLALLVLPPLGEKVSRVKLGLAWGLGAVGAVLAIGGLYAAAGLGSVFKAGPVFHGLPDPGGESIHSWRVLARLLVETPLLLVLVASALVLVGVDLRQRGRQALGWEGLLPESGLLLIGVAVVLFSPQPRSKDLLLVVPFAFLLAFRYGCRLWQQVWEIPIARPLAITVLLFAHFVPFYTGAHRLWQWPTYRQERVIDLAEALTNPAKDSVYDGTGLVPTRSWAYRGWLHDDSNRAAKSRSRDELIAQPPVVLIRSYRTDALSDSDQEFVRSHYLQLGDDFWVLGKVLPKGGGKFEIIHPGRYRISYRKESNLLGTYPEGLAEMLKAAQSKPVENPFVGTVDGVGAGDKPVELKVGPHEIISAGDDEVAVVWVGPRLDKPPQLGRGDHRRLFVNWY